MPEITFDVCEIEIQPRNAIRDEMEYEIKNKEERKRRVMNCK